MDDDRTLVAAARRGDDGAWAVIYDRYADRLHDHCYRILRDHHEAGDALHDAFIAAARNLHQLRDPDRLRPWLYSICRHCSLRRLKARDRVELIDAPDDVSAPDDGLDRGLAAAELGALVWAAAAGLNPRDQALLDLSVRQGLEGQDLADAMGTTLANSYVMLSRMRDQVERSLGALLIARLGQDDCEELAELLRGWDGTFSPLLRKRVARHVDGCEVCKHKRSTVASPLALLALVPVVPAPSELRGRIISSIRHREGNDGPDVRWAKSGFPVGEGGDDRRRPPLAWVGAVAAVLLVLGGLFVAGRDGGDATRDVSTAAPVPERERATTTSTTADDDGTGSTGSLRDDDGGAPSTTGDPDAPTTTAPPGAPTTTVAAGGGSSPTTTTTTAAPAGVEITEVTFAPTAINTTRCESGPYAVTVTAKVRGNPRMVRIRVNANGAGSNVLDDMSPAGDGTWTYTFGQFSQPATTGAVAFEVQAWDATQSPGRKYASVKLTDCPPRSTDQVPG